MIIWSMKWQFSLHTQILRWLDEYIHLQSGECWDRDRVGGENIRHYDQYNDDHHKNYQYYDDHHKNDHHMVTIMRTCSQVNIETEMGSVVKRGMKPSIPYTQLWTWTIIKIIINDNKALEFLYLFTFLCFCKMYPDLKMRIPLFKQLDSWISNVIPVEKGRVA